MIDIKKVRMDTPNCENLIHFNNAGAALCPDSVTNTIKEYLTIEQKVGGYEAAAQNHELIEEFYINVANLINSQAEEIAFIENATRAWDMAFYSIPFNAGDKVITGNAEYASNYIAMLQLSKKLDIEIVVVPDDESGQIDLEILKDSIDEKTKLIAITHVPTNNGLINPAEEIGKIAKSRNILYLLDACQSLGQINVDVKKIDCDFLCGTGRKYLRGPRGTGFLYVKSSISEKIEPIFLDLHAAKWIEMNSFAIRKDARKFENWEYYVAGKLGLSKAVAYCNEIGIRDIENRVSELGDSLRQKLGAISKVKVLDRGREKCGIVTFSTSLDPEQLQASLQNNSFNTSVSYLEYARLDLEPKGLSAISRASVHYYNTEEEVVRFAEEVQKLTS